MPVTMHAEKLRFLIERRFPDYWQLLQRDEPDGRVEALQRYEAELAKLPRSTIDEQYVQAAWEYAREQEEAEERADRLEFFNQPDAAADFRFWCDLEAWSLDEATALLLGKDPRKVSSHRFTYLRQSSPFRKAFEELEGKLDRAVVDGKLEKRNRPSAFVNWAGRVGVPVPEQLSASLDTDGGIPIEGRERTSLLKMIFGMATRRYNYNPADPKSPAPTGIVDDLAELGLQMSQETVRKYLREASSLLPANTIKKNSR